VRKRNEIGGACSVCSRSLLWPSEGSGICTALFAGAVAGGGFGKGFDLGSGAWWSLFANLHVTHRLSNCDAFMSIINLSQAEVYAKRAATAATSCCFFALSAVLASAFSASAFLTLSSSIALVAACTPAVAALAFFASAFFH
jgi:hypothetical protein